MLTNNEGSLSPQEEPIVQTTTSLVIATSQALVPVYLSITRLYEQLTQALLPSSLYELSHPRERNMFSINLAHLLSYIALAVCKNPRVSEQELLTGYLDLQNVASPAPGMVEQQETLSYTTTALPTDSTVGEV